MNQTTTLKHRPCSTKEQLHVVCLTMSKATFALCMMKNLLKKNVLVQALKECSAKVFGIDCLGFQIVGKLDSITPNMCAPWLLMLKSLISSSFAMFVLPKIM